LKSTRAAAVSVELLSAAPTGSVLTNGLDASLNRTTPSAEVSAGADGSGRCSCACGVLQPPTSTETTGSMSRICRMMCDGPGQHARQRRGEGANGFSMT
jgi:hypothetical protein